MAMVLDAFVGRCLSILDQLATEEVVRVLRVKNDLHKLQEKLEMIEDVLFDAERRRIQEAAVNRWLSKLRDVMYDADDIIDRCRIKGHQLLRGGQLRLSTSPERHRWFSFLSCSSCFDTVNSVPFRREIGKEIQKLNQRLEEISKDQIMFSLQHANLNLRVTEVNVRQSSPLANSDLVGREAKIVADKLVASLIKSEGESLLVYAIVGLGGIGKTTLAQKIYNHQKAQASFQKRLWVCVSENYSETELLKQMIRSVAGDQVIHAQNKAELQPLLSSALAGKRFLLVLDDVWRADVWEDLLQTPLEHGGRSSSRVLITTRNEDVARSMRAIQTHQVKKLHANDGWELLCRSVFEDGADVDIQHLHGIGMQIVQKCDGLPLAIKAIAGVLRTKGRSNREWENVYQSHAWSVTGQLPEAVRGALYLSYEDLPSQLKQCFLYCSLFAEDYIFHQAILVRLWVAEGFIAEGGHSLLEDVAEDCYHNLVSRSLLHLDPSVSNGTRCTMHDLTRSLALLLTGNESHLVDANESTTFSSLKLRRLAIKDKEEPAVYLNAVENPHCLRTLHIDNCSQINIQDLFQRFTHLRVLRLNESRIKSIPESIRNLQHLRYLDLDRTAIAELPESIGCLSNLQFLDLSGCKFLHTLPNAITQLCNLRHLGLYNTPISHVPVGIGKLKHLTDIQGFVVAEGGEDDHGSGKHQVGCSLDELQSMSQLRRLTIERLERVRTGGIQPLKDKQYLKELILMCTEDVDQSLISERTEQIYEDLSPSLSIDTLHFRFFYGLKLPGWIGMLPNLAHLTLYRCVSCQQLPQLGQLPQLRVLRIVGASAVVTIGPEFLGCDTKGGPGHSGTPAPFPKLEKLLMYSLPNWQEWAGDVEIKLLPRLQQLEIVDCPKLRALPEGLRNAAALKYCLIRRAGSLSEIKNILSLEKLIVEDSQFLESISNLPELREMQIMDSCRRLKSVENLNMLQSLILYLEDDWIEYLPEWLLSLIKQEKVNGKLETLSLYCSDALAERCIKGGQYWPLLSHIPDIAVHCRLRHS